MLAPSDIFSSTGQVQRQTSPREVEQKEVNGSLSVWVKGASLQICLHPLGTSGMLREECELIWRFYSMGGMDLALL